MDEILKQNPSKSPLQESESHLESEALMPCSEGLREILKAKFERGEIFASPQNAAREEIRAVAIGNFDGMHLGHQKLFENLGEHGAIIVVLTGVGSKLTPFAFRSAFTQKKIFYCELGKIKNLSGGEFIELLGQNFINLLARQMV